MRRRRSGGRPGGFHVQARVEALWRAVDQDGNVLDILVQNRRDKAAARRFFRRLMKRACAVPRVIATDKLRSYRALRRHALGGAPIPQGSQQLGRELPPAHQSP
ncbi:DDE-type integrase/transposase/recombinase [Streptomyces sp. NBC_01643]|uniref:DDE-type integrase/transposase/recombinase n=1 Tax=Streptomyces sp. NBC_01643 TaxID=2975906 RepID=UPI003865FDDC